MAVLLILTIIIVHTPLNLSLHGISSVNRPITAMPLLNIWIAVALVKDHLSGSGAELWSLSCKVVVFSTRQDSSECINNVLIRDAPITGIRLSAVVKNLQYHMHRYHITSVLEVTNATHRCVRFILISLFLIFTRLSCNSCCCWSV